MIESVEEYTRNHTLIKGYCDVVIDENFTSEVCYYIERKMKLNRDNKLKELGI